MRTLFTYRGLEELGESIIYDYTGGNPEKMSCIDIDGLNRDHLGISICYEKFAEQDKSKIGFLADGRTALSVYRNGKVLEVIFPCKTIVLDNYLLRTEESSRRRFTLAHETGHFLLERYNPLQMECYRKKVDTSQEYLPQEMKEDHEIMENQANRLAAVLLMPRYTVFCNLAKYTEKKEICIYGRYNFAPDDKLAIMRAADDTGVSFTAFKNRLDELRILKHCPMRDFLYSDFKREVSCNG